MMNITAWIVTPVSGAIIGYFTNWLAIKMLFRPHTEKRLFGVRLPFTPGLIPKERFALSKKVGETLKNNVFTDEVLMRAVTSPEMADKLAGIADELFLKISLSETTLDQLLNSIMGDRKDDILRKASEVFCAKFAEYIPQALITEIKNIISSKMPDLAAYVASIPDKNPELDEALRKLCAKIAEEQLGKFVGLFVKYDKIYDNIKNNVVEYILQDENQALLAEKACALLDGFLEKDAETLCGKLPAAVSDFVSNAMRMKIGELFSKIPPDSVLWIRGTLIKGITAAVGKGGGYVISSLDIAQIAEDKINDFGVTEAEEIIISVVNKELKMITYLGGVLGLIIGLLPAVINAAASVW